jgi:PhzF family phenazine biosynthesis protein
MPEAQLYQVDAFTDVPFRGNPAAVCIMPCNLPDEVYLSISGEMNLSETAFLEDVGGTYRLRWFTPVREVPLCGHATLATAHVLFQHLGYEGDRIEFRTASGKLYAEKVKEGIRLDFPQNKSFPVAPPVDAIKALGIEEWVDVQYTDTNYKLLIQVEGEDEVRSLNPDFSSFLKAQNPLGWRGAIVTARGKTHDFVSRYFAPYMGVDEDPVTGSAHTVLAPYWGAILKKHKMRAYQASKRGGELFVELSGDRVLLTGKCITVLRGKFDF